MTPRDKLNKEVLNVVSGIKDNVAKVLIQATRNKTVQIEEKQLERVIMLVNQTIDAAYHKSNSVFMRSVDEVLKSAEAESKKKAEG